MPLMYGLILIIVLAVLYGVSLNGNSNTPLPEGCTEVLADCHACSVSTCGHAITSRKEGI